MSIRAEELPKAFEAQFLNSSGQVAEYGALNIKPGDIVGGKKQTLLYTEIHVMHRKVDV